MGLESGNAGFCAGRDLPWLQDSPDVDAWSAWGVQYRDVVIVDDAGFAFAVFNLTEHDLAEPSSYATLKQMLVEAP